MDNPLWILAALAVIILVLLGLRWLAKQEPPIDYSNEQENRD